MPEAAFTTRARTFYHSQEKQLHGNGSRCFVFGDNNISATGCAFFGMRKKGNKP